MPTIRATSPGTISVNGIAIGTTPEWTVDFNLIREGGENEMPVARTTRTSQEIADSIALATPESFTAIRELARIATPGALEILRGHMTNPESEKFYLHAQNINSHNRLWIEVKNPASNRERTTANRYVKFISLFFPEEAHWTIDLPTPPYSEGRYSCVIPVGSHYIGTLINGDYYLHNDRLGRLPVLHIAVQSFRWILAHIKQGTIPEYINLRARHNPYDYPSYTYT